MHIYTLTAQEEEVKEDIYKKSPSSVCEFWLLLFSFINMESEAYSDEWTSLRPQLNQ